jgi:hypothetical protein
MATTKKTKKKPAGKQATKPAPLRGSCCCGAVVFEIDAQPSMAVACHCSRCRRWHGHVGVYTRVPRGAFRFLERKGLRWYDASKTAQRGFCAECGSSLLFSEANSGSMSVCVGALEQPTRLTVGMHLFVGSKGDYYELGDDGAKQFDALP